MYFHTSYLFVYLYVLQNNFIAATPSWIVVDIIMYVATESLVLAFFHRQQGKIKKKKKKRAHYIQNKIIEGLINYTPSLDVSICGDHNSLIHQFRSSSLSTLELYHYHNAAKSSPHQFFHILDNRTKSVLLSWPDHYPNEMDGAQMDLLNDRPMSPEVSCFHCVQQAIRTTPSGEKIHSFIIEYGSIAFVLVHIKKR